MITAAPFQQSRTEPRMLVSLLSSLLYRPAPRTDPMHSSSEHRSSESDARSGATNRRDYYRIHFPVEARPRILLDSRGAVRLVCEVVECSERGLRFLSATRWLRGAGAPLSGSVCFDDGTEVRVSGTVLRVQGDEVAVRLGRECIPLSVILAEQRRLRARYAHSD